METSLRGVSGIFDLNVRLMDGNVGEAEIFYDPAEVTLDEIKPAVSVASGPKHNFVVLSIVEER